MSLLLRQFTGAPLRRRRGAQVPSLQTHGANPLANGYNLAWRHYPMARASKGKPDQKERNEALRLAKERTMQHEEIIAIIASATATSRLEVAVCTDSRGARKTELRRLSWGAGVGWYSQQTLCLDSHETRELLWALRGNRQRWCDQTALEHGKVIPFPVPPQRQETHREHPQVQKKRTGSLSSELPVTEKKRTKRGEEKAATLLA